MLINAQTIGATGAIEIEIDGELAHGVVNLCTEHKRYACYQRDEKGNYIIDDVQCEVKTDVKSFTTAKVTFDNVTIEVK